MVPKKELRLEDTRSKRGRRSGDSLYWLLLLLVPLLYWLTVYRC